MKLKVCWPVIALLVFMVPVAGASSAPDDKGASPQRGSGETIVVRVLSTPECTNTLRTMKLIEATAKEMGVSIDMSRQIVRTQEEADRYRFIGSPTVQIDGLDLEQEMRKHSTFRAT